MTRILDSIKVIYCLGSVRQFFVILIVAIGQVLFIRSILNHILDKTVKKNERKRCESKMKFINSFLYLSYRDKLPKVLLCIFYLILIGHLVSLYFIVLSFINDSIKNISSSITVIVLILDAIWTVVASAIIWVPGRLRPDYDVFLKNNKKRN